MFERLYNIILNESFNNRIVYYPIISNDRISQEFEVFGVKYKINADFFPSHMNFTNLVNIEFVNVDENSYDLTGDSHSPMAVFGTVFNWIDDFIDDRRFKNKVRHIVITSKNSGDAAIFGRRSRLYGKIRDKFLTTHPGWFRNEGLEDSFFNKTELVVFAVSRPENI
jgi:hypothetical protein